MTPLVPVALFVEGALLAEGAFELGTVDTALVTFAPGLLTTGAALDPIVELTAGLRLVFPSLAVGVTTVVLVLVVAVSAGLFELGTFVDPPIGVLTTGCRFVFPSWAKDCETQPKPTRTDAVTIQKILFIFILITLRPKCEAT